MESLIGKTILGYEVKEHIGTGGFGDVYRVERSNIVGKITRALKVITLPKEQQYTEILNSMGGNKEKAEKYFRNELDHVVEEIRVFSMISAKDNHHIVSYYENDVKKIGKYQYQVFILMEIMTPLEKWLQKNNLTVGQALQIGLDIAEGLKVCHDNHIMHRDIKINNIYVSEDNVFKLGDFGVSKRLETMTRAKTIKGTPNYIAPEVYLRKSKYNTSVDIYSLGILLYYLFNKQRYPFMPAYPEAYTRDDEERAFYKRMGLETPSAPAFAPKAIAKVILKAIASEEERYQNIDEFIPDLQKTADSLEQSVLDEKIGFEPKQFEEKAADDDAEDDKLIQKMENDQESDISFRKHGTFTLTKRKNQSNRAGKKWVIAFALIACMVLAGVAAFVVNRKERADLKNNAVQVNSPADTEKVNNLETQRINQAETGEINSTETENTSVVETTTENRAVVLKNYTGKKYKTVKKALQRKKIRVKYKKKYSSKYKKGIIISQKPKKGTLLQPKSSITFVVSKGEKPEPEPETVRYQSPVNNSSGNRYTGGTGYTGGNTYNNNNNNSGNNAQNKKPKTKKEGGGNPFAGGENVY